MQMLKKLLRWGAFVLCFAGIPGLLLVAGLLHEKRQDSVIRLEKLRGDLNRFYQDISKQADPQRFWCVTLSEALADDTIEKTSSVKIGSDIEERLRRLKQKLNFDFLVYTPQKSIFSSSMILEPEHDWKLAVGMVWKIFAPGKPRVSEEEKLAGGRVFGPQLYWEHFDNNIKVDDYYLVWADSTYKKPLLWGKLVHGHLILAFIDIGELEGSDGLWNLLQEFSSRTGNNWLFSMQDDRGTFRHPSLAARHRIQIENAAAEYGLEKTQQITTDDFEVFPMFLRPGVTIFGYLDRSIVVGKIRSDLFWPVVVVFGLLAFLLMRYAWSLIVQECLDDVSLRWKLRFLFFFANGLPLLVLFFIGNDYLAQKRDNLILETHDKAISFIQDFDEKIEIEYARQIVIKEKAQKRMIDALSLNIYDNDALQEFIDALGSQSWKILMVASRSSTVVTERGVYDEKSRLSPDEDFRESEKTRNQNEFTRKLGQFFLDKVNGAAISGKVETELELIVEAATQKPLTNFIYDLSRQKGSIIQWGFGQNVHPAIFDTFSLNNSNTEDLFFLSAFRLMVFQKRFLDHAVPQANRNDLGLKIIALLDSWNTVPESAYKSPVLREFATSLSSYPTKEAKVISYESQPFLAMGVTGRYIKGYKLIGLFPLEKIDQVIDSQRRQLLLFAILSLLMTWGLSQVLAQSFIQPLQQITAGAMAIENKHFSHRLPDLGRDEFGAMGRVFNSVMVDLEELSVASAIQEQLLPQQSIETGFFSLFGRSVSMGELGGDYFDHIELGQQKFSVLLGDVAGHGVGAALIMAMAKAGIIQSESLLDQPLQLLNRLHGLIYSSKTKKQKKIMTFQYLYVDGVSGVATYANAGACSPMIIRKKSGVVEELTLAGAALGAFKKANFSQIEIRFEPGDAIVFYTDGIVEARNQQGEEIGYERLRQIFLESWDGDAGKFYDNVYRAYIQHLGAEGAQDDLTMVFLVFNPERNEMPTA